LRCHRKGQLHGPSDHKGSESGWRQVPLYVTTYQKAMNKYLYLPYLSHHPYHVFRGIIKGELIRYIKTNTYEEDYISIATSFKQRLKQEDILRVCLTSASQMSAIQTGMAIYSKPNYLKSMSIQVFPCSLNSQSFIHQSK
jgi:hypothetical protein